MSIYNISARKMIKVKRLKFMEQINFVYKHKYDIYFKITNNS